MTVDKCIKNFLTLYSNGLTSSISYEKTILNFLKLHRSTLFILLLLITVSTFVGDVKEASDLSSTLSPEEISRLHFHIKHAHGLFVIGKQDGKILTNQVLDRETKCAETTDTCELSFEVIAKSSQHHKSYNVIVKLLDINDHAPQFAKDQFTLNITETAVEGSKFSLPNAEDGDVGSNGLHTYSISSESNLFQLVIVEQFDEKQIKLKLVGKLDREKQEAYSLIVTAADNGQPPLSGSMTVNINVLDANDNSPKFTEPTYSIQVPENIAVSSRLLTIKAVDPDTGINGQVVYSFPDRINKMYGNLFEINSNTGEIFTKGELDYEKNKNYVLTVQADDAGVGSLPNFTLVTVNVTDINDNYPVVVVSALTDTGTPSIEENQKLGTFVAHITVSDADSGVNGETNCHMESDHFKMVMQPEGDYLILSSVKFDREAKSSYRIILICKDKGTPPLESQKEIQIDIVDQNDNAPVLPNSDNIDVYVYENNPLNFIITKINASDVDAGRNAALHYSIEAIPKSETNVLSIDPLNGKISSKIMFDYEKETEYKFLITVSDRGTPSFSATATLNLHVLDINDEAPKFDKPSYYLSVQENNPIGSLAGSVLATDADASPSFNKILYKIVSNDDAFEINEQTGEIKNLKRLDTEEQSQYKFQVVASNSGIPVVESKVNVTVYVDDVNDNAPVFIFPSTEAESVVQVPSDAKPGTLIIRLVATDADKGANAELVFTISNGNVDNSFVIDPTTGVITVAKPLKSADKQDQAHRLVISVSDLGNPPLMSVADLTIIVNSSLNAKDDASLALTGRLSEKHIILLVAIIVAVFLMLICVILVVICLSRRLKKRKRSDKRGNYVSTKVLDVYDGDSSKGCRSPNCNNETNVSTMDCRKIGGGSSSATVDTASTKSEGVCNCNTRGDMGPPPNIMSAVCRGEEDEDEVDMEMCRFHDPNTGNMTTSWDPTQNLRINQGGGGGGGGGNPMDMHTGRCSSANCRNFGSSPSYNYHRHNHCNCCNVHTSCHSPMHPCYHHSNPLQPAQTNTYMMRNKRSLYSPESMPLQPIGRVGHNREDLESVCSGSTWTDSGRGPSEEDDHVKSVRIENYLRTTQAK
ncbi:hypothetical protein HELRODRAFT_188599 [Helobdella robusta]|uniref:Cadherin domain-containing protein n=1 Tax=Helobdella robusta TaxID=6412 RepID=T1FQ59_HELRO|nr:hypothetical protein HELRODRAFT_188599 [Helobdella robusta]ESO02155.1 hypothetical protein HELRODRAFT_188599 [Helobdella robusta]